MPGRMMAAWVLISPKRPIIDHDALRAGAGVVVVAAELDVHVGVEGARGRVQGRDACVGGAADGALVELVLEHAAAASASNVPIAHTREKKWDRPQVRRNFLFLNRGETTGTHALSGTAKANLTLVEGLPSSVTLTVN